MDICKLYEVIKAWEAALVLTKPEAVKKIKVSPIIENNIQDMGEGNIYSYLKMYIETERKYIELIYGEDTTHYKDEAEKKWVEEEHIYSLIEYIEDRMSNDYINSFWEDFPWDITWNPIN